MNLGVKSGGYTGVISTRLVYWSFRLWQWPGFPAPFYCTFSSLLSPIPALDQPQEVSGAYLLFYIQF